jgi:two-component system chemotaxis sensor kinase CheA
VAARRSRTPRPSKAYRDFLAEAEEILEKLRGDVIDLTEQRGDGRAPEPEVVNRLFRSAHSLKGLAGMFSLDRLSRLAHHLEDVLDALRLGRVPLGDAVAGLLDETVSLIGHRMETLDAVDPAGRDDAHTADLLARLRAAAAARSADDDQAFEAIDLEPSLLRALTEYEEHRLRENMRLGRRILLVEATFEVLSFDDGLAELTRGVREAGEVLSTLPSPGAVPESQIRFGLLVATELAAEELMRRVRVPDARCRVVYEADAVGASQPGGPGVPATAESTRESPRAQVLASPEPESESLRSISETVRVDIRRLDELMNLVGDLWVQRGALGAIAARLTGVSGAARIAQDLERVHQALDGRLRELQVGVLEARMVPLRQVFEKLSRVVRRLRRDLGKDVRLELRGAETELDKLMVEALIDPLVHVVRNAFDHGIESAHERFTAGKPAQGQIRIAAFQRGSHVVVQVSDDGRGIDAAAVRARAEERGMVAPDHALTPKETLELILLPGFSTRDDVTEISGRGVGMDVVKANLTALSGVVDVESIAGGGTTISMTLPITLAIIQALLVRVADQSFAIPLTSVIETLALAEGDVQRSARCRLLNLRGEPLVLHWLRDEFGLGADPDPAGGFVVAVKVGDARLGLVVDQLLVQQDAVIKPIQGPVRHIRGIAGATDLGERGTLLVLDVAAIVEDVATRRDAA